MTFAELPMGARFWRGTNMGVVLEKVGHATARSYRATMAIGPRETVTLLRRWRIGKGSAVMMTWRPDYESAARAANGGFKNPDSIVLMD